MRTQGSDDNQGAGCVVQLDGPSCGTHYKVCMDVNGKKVCMGILYIGELSHARGAHGPYMVDHVEMGLEGLKDLVVTYSFKKIKRKKPT